MDHDWAFVTRLEIAHSDVVLLVSQFFTLVIVSLLVLGSSFLLNLLRSSFISFWSWILVLMLGGGFIAKGEAVWKHEVQLDGTALMRPANSIIKLDVNLWSIKGSVSWVDLPVLTKEVECLTKLLFGRIPLLDFA